MLSQVGSRYTGAAGNAYFDEYRQGGELSARFSARKFASRIAPGDTVVDFGCGSGLMLEELPGKLKIGIEPIESARISANDRGTQVVASATELQDDLADVVVSNHALEHTLNPWSELRELHRILRDGGKLLLSLPLDDWRVQRYLLKRDKDQHLYTWTPRLLRNLLTEAGYAVTDVRVVTRAWPPRARLFAGLPPKLFDWLCYAVAVLRFRRQLEAIAIKPHR